MLKAIGNTGSLRGISALEHSLSETAETTDELNFERRLAAIYALQDMASVAPAKATNLIESTLRLLLTVHLCYR